MLGIITVLVVCLVSGVYSEELSPLLSLSPAERKKRKNDFALLSSNHNPHSWGCSNFDDIFSTMRKVDPSRNKLFVDIGFNKG